MRINSGLSLFAFQFILISSPADGPQDKSNGILRTRLSFSLKRRVFDLGTKMQIFKDF